jgi:tetratricopeptide (TPR) repeat protein
MSSFAKSVSSHFAPKNSEHRPHQPFLVRQEIPQFYISWLCCWFQPASYLEILKSLSSRLKILVTMTSPGPSETTNLLEQLGLLSVRPADSQQDRSAEEESLKTRRAQITRHIGRGELRDALMLEGEQLRALCAMYGDKDNRAIFSLDNMVRLSSNLGNREMHAKLIQRSCALKIQCSSESPSSSSAGAVAQGRNVALFSAILDSYREAEDIEDPRDLALLAAKFRDRADYAKAEEALKKAVDLQANRLGNEHLETIKYTAKLGEVHCLQGRWVDAQRTLEPALTLTRGILGDGDAETIGIVRLLERVYRYLGRWQDANLMEQWLLGSSGENLDMRHVEVFESMMSLTTTYLTLGRWKDAIDTLKTVADATKQLLPPNDLVVKLTEGQLQFVQSNAPRDWQFEALTARYIYSPLSGDGREIRIVSVKNLPGSTALQVTLTHTPLDCAPSYEALSYVWGDMQEPRTLMLNGYPLEITRNLWTALQHLVPPGQERMLWVDAICINQSDLPERSSQVRLMRDIYATANRTIVWLGEEGNGSDIAMSFLKDMEVHPSPPDLIQQTFMSCTDDLCDALLHLFTGREYWSRLWVIQEVTCAKEVIAQCGRSEVGYPIMRDLAGKMTEVFETITHEDDTLKDEDFPVLVKYSKLISALVGSGPFYKTLPVDGVSDEMTLLRLIGMQRSHFCTDPRDRVYAVLGISTLANSDHPGLKIDYSKPVGNVYLGATRAIIDETSRLDVICLTSESMTKPSHFRIRQPFLPSWAPDWNVYPSTTPLSHVNLQADASPSSKSNFKFSQDGTVINAEGVIIASLESCGPGIPSDYVPDKELIRYLLGWRMFAQGMTGILPGNNFGLLLDPFYTMISCGHRDIMQYLDNIRIWFYQWEQDIMTSKSVDALKSSNSQKPLLGLWYSYCKGRRMFLYAGPQVVWPAPNKLGMTSSAAKNGDILCVLLGCKFPVVLRRKERHYVFVGEAFVPDYANGEAMREIAEGKRSLEKFEIH